MLLSTLLQKPLLCPSHTATKLLGNPLEVPGGGGCSTPSLVTTRFASPSHPRLNWHFQAQTAQSILIRLCHLAMLMELTMIINGHIIFIVFIHDLNSTWQELAHNRGIVFDAKTGTTIIVDDIFSWAPTFETAVAYMACHFQVCQSQNLSLSLQRCLFFPA